MIFVGVWFVWINVKIGFLIIEKVLIIVVNKNKIVKNKMVINNLWMLKGVKCEILIFNWFINNWWIIFVNFILIVEFIKVVVIFIMNVLEKIICVIFLFFVFSIINMV